MTERERCELIAAADLGWLAMMALWSGQQVAAAEALGATAEDMQPPQPGDVYSFLAWCIALNIDDMAEHAMPIGPTWMYPTGVMF